MKKIFAFILIAGLSLGISSCDKFFDSMEGDLSKVAAEDLLNTENGLLSLLANLYSALPDMSVSSSSALAPATFLPMGTPSRVSGTTRRSVP